MKRLFPLLILFLFFISCHKSYRILHEGVWVDEQSEMQQLSIIKKNDSLFLQFSGNESYYIHEAKYNNYVMVDNRKLPIWEKDHRIKFAKKTYIPKSLTLKHKFSGTWTNKKSGITIRVKLINGSSEWEITNEKNNVSNTYYPKKTKNGFAITLNGNVIEFKREGNYLVDSNGHKYLNQTE